jgi:hypothetical protein
VIPATNEGEETQTVELRWQEKMSTVPNHVVANGVNYYHHPHHRNATIKKSQWTIAPGDERQVFVLCLTRAWIVETDGLGRNRCSERQEVASLSAGTA